MLEIGCILFLSVTRRSQISAQLVTRRVAAALIGLPIAAHRSCNHVAVADPLPEECPFCRIVSGEDAAARIVWEQPDWVAFFPDAPATVGHTLVVPRAHVAHYWALSDDQASMLAKASLRIGRAIEAALHPEGMNLITSRGHAAEQSIPHVHLHVLPRWIGDALDPIWPPKHLTESAALADAADRIRATLSAS
jgi:histidine triad (HIT) family protein